MPHPSVRSTTTSTRSPRSVPVTCAAPGRRRSGCRRGPGRRGARLTTALRSDDASQLVATRAAATRPPCIRRGCRGSCCRRPNRCHRPAAPPSPPPQPASAHDHHREHEPGAPHRSYLRRAGVRHTGAMTGPDVHAVTARCAAAPRRSTRSAPASAPPSGRRSRGRSTTPSPAAGCAHRARTAAPTGCASTSAPTIFTLTGDGRAATR